MIEAAMLAIMFIFRHLVLRPMPAAYIDARLCQSAAAYLAKAQRARCNRARNERRFDISGNDLLAISDNDNKILNIGRDKQRRPNESSSRGIMTCERPTPYLAALNGRLPIGE